MMASVATNIANIEIAAALPREESIGCLANAKLPKAVIVVRADRVIAETGSSDFERRANTRKAA